MPSAADGAASTKITDAEYNLLCELLYRHTGIRFGQHKRYFVDKRVHDRMKATSTEGASDYLRKLRLASGGEEMQHLIETMTVNETYFYRETEQLDTMVSILLPELSSRRRADEVRIWSMPCSTGEEPYSIAIKLLEDWPDVDNHDISIFASDIDGQVIEKAKTGLYSERSVSHLPKEVLKTYFSGVGDRWQVIEELRESISFRRANVLERKDTIRYQQMDFIFCRNMLIYFDDLSRRKAIDVFYEALRPGGYLFLGASESIGHSTRLFEPKRNRGQSFYRRPLQGGR